MPRCSGPQRGAPDKAAAAILQAAENSEPPKLLLLGSDALGGFRAAADDAARDVGMSGTDDHYRDALPGSNVRDGLAVRGETVTQAASGLDEWLYTNDLI
jgi:hypothetical protein